MCRLNMIQMTKRILLLTVFIAGLLVPGYLAAQVQKVIVKGTVMDRETRQGIPDVTILLDGKPPKPTSFTDRDGRYTIAVAPESTLIFRYIGYNENRVKIKSGQTLLNITLSASSSDMEEVVVRGYQKRLKETST